MRLSVIIPGYENPSWRWFRCVDDGSRKDALPDFNDPRVRCVRLGENGGLSVARNAGLDAASGEYVAFVDSDDEVMDDVYVKTLAVGLFTGRWILMVLGETDYGLYGVVGGLMAFVTFLNGLMAQAMAAALELMKTFGRSGGVPC